MVAAAALPATATATATATEAAGRSAFARCARVSRRPLALALLLCATQGMFAPFTALAEPTAPAAAKEQALPAVNINTASAEELAERLSGVGDSKAQAIVRYREQFGAFESVEELAEVAGIGAATVERNRERIRLR